MRWIAAILLVTLAPGLAAGAADDPRRAQVAAATADALDALRDEILSAPVTSEVTVEEFVARTDAHDQLAKALKRAEQIGGTRWLDDQTCQVRMELRGSELADTLVEIAAAHRGKAGLPPDVLRARVAGLSETVFSGTGMSTCAVDRLRPGPDDEAWHGVPADAIRAAVNDARHSAAEQIIESVAYLPLPSGEPLGRVFEDRKVRDALEGWAMNRPVTSVEFEPDLEVRVTVAASGEDFWDELVAITADRADIPFPKDDGTRSDLRQRVLARIEPTVGRARAARPGVPPDAAAVERAAQPVVIPAHPPRWVAQHLSVKGAAARVDGGLKTARAAEKAARADLRKHVEALKLTADLTLAAAARHDRRVRDALDRTLRRAKVSKVNYLANGHAEVSISLDLRELWYELDGLR